jgi:hypothetical protein
MSTYVRRPTMPLKTLQPNFGFGSVTNKNFDKSTHPQIEQYQNIAYWYKTYIQQTQKKLELYPDLVIWYGIGWHFLGIFLTDTEGKLSKDLRYRTFGGNPFFAPFCPIFDGPSPPFEGSSRKISQNGAPTKSYSKKKPYIPYQISTDKCW